MLVRRHDINSIRLDRSFLGNLLDRNFRGINYFVDCSRVGSPDGGYAGEEFYMQNNASHDNTIVVGTQTGALANGLSYTSCSAAQLAPYLNGSMGLTFFRDTYQVPSSLAGYWFWNGLKDWHQWQALGHDGSVP